MKSLKIGLALAVIATCLALSGCWISPKILFDPPQGARPLRDGLYFNPDEQRVRVTWVGHGWYKINDGHLTKAQARRQSQPLLLIALPQAGPNTFIYASTDENCAADFKRCKRWIYGVVRVSDGDTINEDMPLCSETTALARAHAAKVQEIKDDQSRCVFNSGADMAAALTEFAKAAKFVNSYQRMTD
jgi:hypothetical protein